MLGEEKWKLGKNGEIKISNDGNIIAIGQYVETGGKTSEVPSLLVYNQSGELLWSREMDGRPRKPASQLVDVVVSPTGRYILAGEGWTEGLGEEGEGIPVKNRNLYCYDGEGKLIWTYPNLIPSKVLDNGFVFALAKVPKRYKLIFLNPKGEKVWELKNGTFNDDVFVQKFLCSGSDDGTKILVSNGTELVALHNSDPSILDKQKK